MSSLPNPRFSGSATALLVVLVAVPLLGLVTALFIAALRLPLHGDLNETVKTSQTHAISPNDALKSSVAEIEPAQVKVANEPPAPAQLPVHPPVASRAEPT